MPQLSTDQKRFGKGQRVVCWGELATVGEQLSSSANILFLHFDNGTTDSIITHFIDGPNQRIRAYTENPTTEELAYDEQCRKETAEMKRSLAEIQKTKAEWEQRRYSSFRR